MRLILHICWKDTRHLWKEIAVTWLLLACLTRMDSWRGGYVPGPTEGWLNLLVPLAWSYLTAVCVLQDAVSGERQFWLTLPHRNITFPAAKALFLIAFIHVPYLISNALILESRGFDPLHFIPHLLQKQCFLLLALTLPSFALASVVRNAAQFMTAAIAIAAVATLITGSGELSPLSLEPFPWLTPDEVRRDLVLSILALVSTAILWLQYRERLTLASRSVGFAGLVAAGALYFWLPPRSSATIQAVLQPSKLSLNLRLRDLAPGQRPHPFYPLENRIRISIPVEAIPPLSPDRVSLRHLDLEIDSADSLRVRVPSQFAYLSNAPSYLDFAIEPAAYKRLANTPVTLIGHVAAELQETRTGVKDLARCARSFGKGSWRGDEVFQVSCESPVTFSEAHAILTDTTSNRYWDELLGGAVTMVSYPRITWLSPMNRREAFFHITPVELIQPGSQWMVPREVLQHYRLELQSHPIVGRMVFKYQLDGMELSKYADKRRDY